MGRLSFGATGLSYQVDSVKVKTSGAPLCPRCGQRVFFMEQMLANGKSWHKKCYSCVSCKKSLDSTNCCAHEEEIYCKMCHKREFGPRGYGYAGGAAGLSTDSAFGRKLNATSPKTSSSKTQVTPKRGKTGSVFDQMQVRDVCPRCQKRVYQAEEVKANGKGWHRLCFKCVNCTKMLERGRTNEHEGELYCNACYTRNYGIRGYGFAGGNGSLLSTVPKTRTRTRTSSTESPPPPPALNGPTHPAGGSSGGTSPSSVSLEGSPNGSPRDGSPLNLQYESPGSSGLHAGDTEYMIAHHSASSASANGALGSNTNWRKAAEYI